MTSSSLAARRAAAALDRLGLLHPKLIDLSLDRVWRLLAALGNPQDRLPPVIHIAGTNGKGSTVAYLRACLTAAGLRVHSYISPHLVRFNERITLAGEMISDGALADLLERIETVNEGQPITFFEVTTCAAFAAFAEVPADVLILETGLGGRLDATNVVARPAATVLTPIGLDHEQFLGPTVAAIATEKAHIIKTGTPCVSAVQVPEAGAVLRAMAAQRQVPLAVAGEAFRVGVEDDQLVYSPIAGGAPWRLPLPALLGDHQIANAGVALAALEVARDPRTGASLTPALEALATGMRTVSWPARMQRLTRGPLVDALPAGWELWLDGAHNPQAGAMLAGFLPRWADQPLDMIMGMMGPKDAEGFFRPLAAQVDRLRAVPVPQEPNAKSPELVATAGQQAGIADVAVCDSVTAALEALRQTAGDSPRRVLICGSLYLAGTVLADNQ
ncbi:bifunctional folylpolyglutamate synthase/dihydrofolate synthase [Insolitispirillum peregrinum]|uniref:bifunctional folylpolyglutamate synthase/dihydrofolate synthase n=1 Tax=Insolitispirillum peregrinum TaxID=80876 RepID=UPI00361EC886